MQQIWIRRGGGPEVLRVEDAADPEPGPGQLRIRVEASGVNFADLLARMGLYPDAPPLPMVVGYEVAGRIDAVGAGVSPARLGEPVVAATQFGGYASAVVVAEALVITRPPGLSSVDAAAIPVTGLTAWMMLVEMGRVRTGDRVLVHGAGGGVGLMALDLLRWKGAYAVGTASRVKHEVLRAHGYDQLIDPRTGELEQALRGQDGFDLVLDPIGGRSWRQSFHLLRPGGRMICYGLSDYAPGASRSYWAALRTLLAIPWLQFQPFALFNANKGVMGVNMGRMWSEAPLVAAWLAQLISLWSEGVIRPRVHAVVPFSRAAEAHRILHDRENIGKVVLVPDPD